MVEWIDRLADTFEIHVYSQRVEDIDPAKITWHKVSQLPGPHLVNFLWWFGANRRARRRDACTKGLEFDLVFSPGINCFDADAVTVHIVFAELVKQMGGKLKFKNNRLALWPRLLHRRIYYRTIMRLERWVFRNPTMQVVLTARHSAKEIREFFGRNEDLPVISPGLDHGTFNPELRRSLRPEARRALELDDSHLVLLLVGNDWRNKGLETLLAALGQTSNLPIDLLVAGSDDPAPFLPIIRKKSLESRVRFLPRRKDVEFYYAAADVYVGPSLEDTFALPALEAMACGLPVIISARAGAAGVVSHKSDGVILRDPTNAFELASLIRELYLSAEMREALGKNAAATASQFTWERSANELASVLRSVLEKKRSAGRMPSVIKVGP